MLCAEALVAPLFQPGCVEAPRGGEEELCCKRKAGARGWMYFTAAASPIPASGGELGCAAGSLLALLCSITKNTSQ